MQVRNLKEIKTEPCHCPLCHGIPIVHIHCLGDHREVKPKMPCPCRSGKEYEECCKPYHTGLISPPSALLLMRSRYSAYALGLAKYIIETTHPQHPEAQKNHWQWREEILAFSRGTEFLDLDVLSSEEFDDTAFVTFSVSLKQGDKEVSFTEKSRFEKSEGLWLYKEAEFL